MFPAAKNMDPAVGVDIHIIQPPGPVPPVPIPHPFVGMLIDPFDFIPVVGATVLVNGVPRAIAGTAGKAIPPHIPIGGMFVKPPASECELFMGSATVSIDGDAAGYTALPCLSCHDVGMPPPPRVNPKKKSKVKSLVLPTSVVLPIPMGLPVLIGGAPTIFTMALAQKLGMALLGRAFRRLRALQRGSRRWRALSVRMNRAANRLLRRMSVPPASRLRNLVRRSICTLTGHPVDVATGKVLTDSVDLELPGPLPFRLERVWYSTSAHDGPFGKGWHHSYDLALAIDASSPVAVVRLADGRYAPFALPTHETPARNELEKAWLRLEPEGYVFEDEAGLRHHFGHPPATERETWLPLLKQEDAFGNAVTLHYGPQGHLRGIVDSAGRRLPVSTDARGRITEIQGPHPTVSNREVTLLSYRYSYEGELVEARDALGHPFRYGYDDQHRLAEETDRLGLTFYFEYEGSGIESRCVHTWGDGGVFERHLTYDLVAQTTRVVDSRGGVTVHEWNALGLVTRTVDPLGGERRFEYDADARLLSETGPLGETVVYTYDPEGRLSALTDPTGAVQTVQRTDGVETLTDADGHAWSHAVDGRGALVSETDPDGAETQYVVDERGQPSAITDPRDRTTQLRWDDEGNLSHVRDRTGSVTSMSYDALGRLIRVTHPDGGETAMAYDATGNLTRYTDPGGLAHHLTYDAAGNLTEASTPSTGTVRYTFAPVAPGGRLQSIHEASGARFDYRYDPEGDVTGIQDPMGRRWSFERDRAGRVVTEREFSGRQLEYRYDASDGLVARRDGNGRVTRFERDPMGRLLRRAFDDGTAETFLYSPAGRLLMAQNAETAVAREYDPCGRVAAETQGTDRLQNAFDAAGHRIERVFGEHPVVQFAFDGEGGLVGLRAGGRPLLQLQRDALGRETERRFADVTSQRRYSPVGALVAQRVVAESSPRPLLERHYAHDGAHRIQGIIETARGESRYTRTPDGFIATATHASGATETYDYDRALGASAAPPSLQAPHAHAGWHLTFDADGNLVSKQNAETSFRFEYDAAGRLARAEKDGAEVARFGYDALGRRVRKTTPTREVTYLWDGDVLAVERRKRRDVPSSSTRHEFVHDGWVPVALLRDGQQAALVECDQNGLPRLVVSPDGDVLWEGVANVSGALRREEGPLSVELRYPGQIHDPETGLFYNRFRYYDPELHIYLQPDPLGSMAGMSPYNYVHDPLAWIDPYGLNSCTLARNMLRGGQIRPRNVQAHHVIPSAVWRDNAAFLNRIGLRGQRDSAFNGLFMANSQRRMREMGQRAYHRGSHRNYNNMVDAEVGDISRRHAAGQLTDRQARHEVRRLQMDLKNRLLLGNVSRGHTQVRHADRLN